MEPALSESTTVLTSVPEGEVNFWSPAAACMSAVSPPSPKAATALSRAEPSVTTRSLSPFTATFSQVRIVRVASQSRLVLPDTSTT